jgi:hypothetical protein
MIWGTLLKSGFDQMPVSAADYLDWKRQARSFDQMSAAFAIPEYGLNVSGAGDPERVPAALASKEFLPALGIKPIVGRNFLPEEDRPGGPPAVLISHAFLAAPLSFRSRGGRAHADGGWHPAHGRRRGPARARRNGGRGFVAAHRHRSQ